jgi:hypothetical protein
MNERELKQFIKVNILGTNYEIIFKSIDEEPRLKENWGFTDFHTKEIYIANDIEKETENSCKNLIDFKNKVMRHEILHAFLYESGLRENSNSTVAWAENEEMIDWFAIQIPKIVEVYKELNIF